MTMAIIVTMATQTKIMPRTRIRQIITMTRTRTIAILVQMVIQTMQLMAVTASARLLLLGSTDKVDKLVKSIPMLYAATAQS